MLKAQTGIFSHTDVHSINIYTYPYIPFVGPRPRSAPPPISKTLVAQTHDQSTIETQNPSSDLPNSTNNPPCL